MLRISRRGPICSRPSQSGVGHSGIRKSGIPDDLIHAASPDRRFACFAGTQKSLRILGVKSKESLQLSLRIGLPGVAAGSAREGLSAPPRTHFARARSVGLHFRCFLTFERFLASVEIQLFQQPCDIEFDMVFTVLSALSWFSLKSLQLNNMHPVETKHSLFKKCVYARNLNKRRSSQKRVFRLDRTVLWDFRVEF